MLLGILKTFLFIWLVAICISFYKMKTTFTHFPIGKLLFLYGFLRDIPSLSTIYVANTFPSSFVFYFYCDIDRLTFYLINFLLNLGWERSSTPWDQINIRLPFLSVHFWSFNSLFHLEILWVWWLVETNLCFFQKVVFLFHYHALSNSSYSSCF